MTNTKTGFPSFAVGSWERPDAGGIVRRGEAAEFRTRWPEGAAPRCFAGHEFGCEREAVMEVYGLQFCGLHGEEAASGAMEEIVYDLEKYLDLPAGYHVGGLGPHIRHACRQARDAVPYDDSDADAPLLAAYPLDRERVDKASVAYAEDPDANGRGDYFPPYDTFRMARLTLCRHLRLAYEEGETWLVEMLEAEREKVSAQTAGALALQEEAGQ